MSRHQKRAGRKPLADTIGSRDDWRAKLNAALEARGERTIRPRDEIDAEFRRSKFFQEKADLTAKNAKNARGAGG